MGRLVRMDGAGHSVVAEWTPGDAETEEAAVAAFREELDRGMFAAATLEDGTAEHVRELPLEAEMVVLRRPISGG